MTPDEYAYDAAERAREHAERTWPIMKAFAERKQVQASLDKIIWETPSHPDFARSDLHWRIKPEPRVLQVLLSKNGNILSTIIFDSENEQREHCERWERAYDDGTVVKFVEVVE